MHCHSLWQQMLQVSIEFQPRQEFCLHSSSTIAILSGSDVKVFFTQSRLITTNNGYRQKRSLEAWHMNLNHNGSY